MANLGVVLKPVVNEKSMNLLKGEWYTFVVDKNASKEVISRVVKEMFKVDPIEVRVVNVRGKKKAQKTRRGYYTTQSLKKALVKVKKGQKIAIFEKALAPKEEEKEVKVVTAEGEEIAKVKEKKSLLKGTKVKVEKKLAASEKEQSLSSKKKGEKK